MKAIWKMYCKYRFFTAGTHRSLLAVIGLLCISAALNIAEAEEPTKAAGSKDVIAPDKKGASASGNNVAVKSIQLSYTSTERGIDILTSYGITELKKKEAWSLFQQDSESKPDALPAVMAVPEPKSNSVNLPEGVDANFSQTVTSRLNQIMVFYNPERPEQYGRVKSLLQETIDVPAKQLMIEAMVLEISKSSLEEMGVEWRLNEPSESNFFNEKVTSDLKVGRIVPSELEDRAQLDVTFTNIFREFNTHLQALVRTNKAQVLSRPSVLTLNNRMAQINVTKDIPIAQSKFSKNQDIKAVDFREVTAGIKLNVRPRIASQNDWVTMQVMASVSAEVPGEEEAVKSNDGTTLATSPTISHRTVKTHARIRNKTPFIIGGLVAKDDTTETHKVPLLGDIPIFGKLFRSERTNNTKREVIIVLTPFVLSKDQVVDRQLPKDADTFDSAGNKLFRDAYRIRGEDVFDLGFLTENKQLKNMQRIADRIVTNRPRLKDKFPFRKFINQRIPGEHILVYRQIYEVIKRKKLASPLQSDKIIYFHPDKQEPAGFDVKFINEQLNEAARTALRENQDKAVPSEINNPWQILKEENRALAMTFTLHNKAGSVMQQPVPEIKVVKTTEEQGWDEKLAEMNQHDFQKQPQYTILLHEPSHLKRLKRAILVNKTIQLNAPDKNNISLQDFSIGRTLLLPDFDETAIHLVDGDVAKYFYYTEQYYSALRDELQQTTQTLQQKLNQPEFSQYKINQTGPPPSEVIPAQQPND